MENNTELYHHGTRGMKWGIRRYQNKDGSLTPAGERRYNKEVEKLKKETAKVKAAEKVAANKKKTQTKLDALEAKKAALEKRKKALKGETVDDDKEETPAERKARLLKSTDANELYKHKDELTTAELNERLNRIDTEARLQGKIVQEHAKTGMDKVDELSKGIKSATNLYKSVDDAASSVMNSYIGKTIAKKLGLEPPKKEFNLAETWKNRNKLSTQEMQDLSKRLTAENHSKKIIKEWNDEANAAKEAKRAEKEAKKAEKTKRDAQKQVDEYNRKWQRGETDDSTRPGFDPNGKYARTNKDKNTGARSGDNDFRTNPNKIGIEQKVTYLKSDDYEIIEPSKDWLRRYENYTKNNTVSRDNSSYETGRSYLALLEDKNKW